MPEEKWRRRRLHRGMPAQKRVLAAIVGSSVLFLATQYMFWRTFNPFQSGVDEVELDHKMWMLLQEDDDPSPQQHAPHTSAHGLVHHRNMPSNPGNKSFCLRWTSEDAFNRTLQPFDDWWVHHPTWVISNETDDRFCVERGKNSALMQSFQNFYHTQFETGCKEIHWRNMWSSGWGADMVNVQVSASMNVSFIRII
jgi:hypothetical protein